MGNMEERNYWNDPRVRSSMVSKAYKVVSSDSHKTTVQLNEHLLESLKDSGVLEEEHDGALTGTTKFEVCGLCRGSGKVTNPSVYCNGLTREDFDDDPDFYHDYTNGVYDVTCPECEGQRVVPEICLGESIDKAIAEWYAGEIEYANECAAERAYGC